MFFVPKPVNSSQGSGSIRLGASKPQVFQFPAYSFCHRESSEKAALLCQLSGSLPLGATRPDYIGKKVWRGTDDFGGWSYIWRWEV